MRLIPAYQGQTSAPHQKGRWNRWSAQVGVPLFFALLGVAYVWRYLHTSPDPAASLFLKGNWDIPYRIFGPAVPYPLSAVPVKVPNDFSYHFFTEQEQRDFVKQFGMYCQKGFAPKARENLILKRYDELPAPYAQELWKYCVLYTGVGNVYWETDNMDPLILWKDVLVEPISKTSKAAIVDANVAIQMETADHDFILAFKEKLKLHHGFLRMAKPHSKVCLGMMRYIVETPHLHPVALQETLGLYVSHDMRMRNTHWKLFPGRCLESGTVQGLYHQKEKRVLIKPHRVTSTTVGSTAEPDHILARPCPMAMGGHCCQVWRNVGDDWPALAIHHPYLTDKTSATTSVLALTGPSLTTTGSSSSSTTRRTEVSLPPHPFLFADRPAAEMTDAALAMPVADIPYIATVRSYPTGAQPATPYDTPNFFDIMLRNNCLPNDRECFKCLKTGYEDSSVGGNCQVCHDVCPCYCSALCQIRPPPKRLVAEWVVTKPAVRKDPHRIVPRVIHQTWFEPVTKEGYPNMSRLVESFRNAGWEYEFYDDDRAAQFLSAHFPPEVREAYDAIIPGAFKADLFRYCVLLIRGGVYADMDILLESNLDQVVDGSIGYMVPQDSPGMTMGHRSCLWNGLMAAHPGHPFLVQTIQNVVNNVRNRFTSVDYDDMLCPDPVLAVAHTVDTLYTCGPCILGASMNDVLHRHRQSSFEYGEIDLYRTEVETGLAALDPDDVRLHMEGRALILRQNKEDMGSHRFTRDEMNALVAVTDMPEYDDRPKSLGHYSDAHEKFGVYGLSKLYTNNQRANEVFKIRIQS